MTSSPGKHPSVALASCCFPLERLLSAARVHSTRLGRTAVSSAQAPSPECRRRPRLRNPRTPEGTHGEWRKGAEGNEPCNTHTGLQDEATPGQSWAWGSGAMRTARRRAAPRRGLWRTPHGPLRVITEQRDREIQCRMGKIYNFIFNQGILSFPFNKYKLIKILCFAKRLPLFFLQISWKPPWPLSMWLQCPRSSRVHTTPPHAVPLCGEGSVSYEWACKYNLDEYVSFPPLPNASPVLNSQS